MQIAPYSRTCKPTPIADMVRRLVAAGCSTEQIIIAIEGHELAIPVEFPVDEVAQRRREYDRERKRKKSNSGGIPPDSAETTISYKEVTVNKDKKESKKERLRPIPPDWKPNEHHHNLCRQEGIQLAAVEQVFRESCAATGRLYANHDFAFNTYIRNYNRFNGKPVSTNRKDRRAEEFDEIRAELKRSIDADRARQNGNQPIAGLLPFNSGK